VAPPGWPWRKPTPQLVAQLQATRTRLDAAAVHIQRGDGLMAMARVAPGSLELVLLDPPFDSNLFDKALAAAAQAVAPGGFVYLEAPQAWTDERLQPLGLALHRHLKAGAVHAHLLG
jgi:16S rRNA (guanine966-N2)-methyltransferase